MAVGRISGVGRSSYMQALDLVTRAMCSGCGQEKNAHVPVCVEARALIGQTVKVAKSKRVKLPGRNQRWQNAAADAVTALMTLQELQQEYSDWKDNLPENLAQSVLGEKLDAVCDLDVENVLSTVQEAESIDLPLGFGRD